MATFVKRLTGIVSTALFSVSVFAQNVVLPDTLRIGLIPNVSANILMANYAPIKDFFLGHGFQKVTLVSAQNFKEFNEQTKAQEFDLIVTAPHMARLAQVDYKYEPLVAMTPNIKALLIVAIDEKTGVNELKNTTIAYANPQSLVAMIGNKWLANKSLQANIDYTAITVPREDNIGNVILEGKAKFGILSNAELRAIPERFQSKLKIIEVLADIPNFVILSNANFSSHQNQQLKLLFKKFSDTHQFGDQFFKLTGFTAMRPATEVQMKSLDAYLAQTRTALGQ
jgi:phosphonate transport system substrate-binding protein